jgi:hypothetical protein
LRGDVACVSRYDFLEIPRFFHFGGSWGLIRYPRFQKKYSWFEENKSGNSIPNYVKKLIAEKPRKAQRTFSIFFFLI